MSGPKSSRYTLTPEQRRILEEQRKIERRKAKASESIKNNQKKLLQLSSLLDNQKKISDEFMNFTHHDTGFYNKMSEFETLKLSIDNTISTLNKDDVSSLEESAKSVAESMKKAEILAKELSEIAFRNEIELQKHLNNAIDRVSKTSFQDVESESSLSIQKDKLKVQLKQLQNIDYLSSELKTDIHNTIQYVDTIEQEEFLKNYSSLTFTPLVKRCKAYIEEYEKCYDEYSDLYNEYMALCQLYYYVPTDYPCCKESLEKLKTEIHRIQEETAQDDEQSYISECLDEVMEEMGYKVLGTREVVKKNGKRFRNELYTYSEGTAVNITYSSDGKIAMELGGIDKTDRLPSDDEASALCLSMEAFCDDFKEIEERLLAKGVILANRISHLPISREYAQIINIEDYSLETDVNSLQVKKQKRNIKKVKVMKGD